jgi:predicted GIY-YIG superfamily endonuclease
MPFTAYVIRNDAGAIYVGSTGNIEKRLRKHNAPSGGCRFTRANAGPWTVIRSQSFGNRFAARAAEHEWHSAYVAAGHRNVGPPRIMSEAKARSIAKRAAEAEAMAAERATQNDARSAEE